MESLKSVQIVEVELHNGEKYFTIKGMGLFHPNSFPSVEEAVAFVKKRLGREIKSERVVETLLA